MAEISDYTTGKILSDTKLALRMIKLLNVPLIGLLIGKKLVKKIKSFEPYLINFNIASFFINKSTKCAVGERVCKTLHQRSKPTMSIFLDELADAMVAAGKANYVTKIQAHTELKKYRQPIILSKVSDNFAEICCTIPEDCIFWNMERKGFKVVSKRGRYL